MQPRFLKSFVLAVFAFALLAQCGSAQDGQRLRQLWAQRQVRQTGADGAVKTGQPGARAMAGLPPRWVERLRDLPPDEQQRFLQNNRQFQQLPPERQEQIRRNLERWNNLTPDQKQALTDREKVLERMTPEQRQYVQNTLLPKWQAMPQPRRQVINQHLKMLSNMSQSTQEAALNDPKFLEGLSPDERTMLRQLNSLRNPPPGPASPQQ